MPPHKKSRVSVAHASTVSEATPAASSAGDDSPVPKTSRLPSKINESRPLPSLPERQAPDLPIDEYQSIASSAVLSASLVRSKQRWICDGLFERYWVKPETGKHAKPPPPNNPESKWMKLKGPCRIRVEPHVFEADLFLEEKAKPPPPPKQYIPPAGQAAFGQPYRPSQTNQHYIQRQVSAPVTPVTNQSKVPQHVAINAPPATSNHIPKPQISQPMTQAKPQHSSPAPPSTEKKQSPDPVISMLAARASSDPELKGLMKEVATGHATPEQLKIFQRHIDELTAIIQKQKKAEEMAAPQHLQKSNAQKSQTIKQEQITSNPPHSHPPPQPPSQAQPPQRTPLPQPLSRPPEPSPAQSYGQQPLQTPSAPQFQQQQPWVPPKPLPVPVILGFTTPGASEDRFLFPQYSILEALSPQHTLASFIVTRKGRDAADPLSLDLEVEYWQPVTMMVEVAYGREELLNHLRRWVKPAEETRRHMEEIMDRCTRVPKSHLALRLPYRGASAAEIDELYSTSVLAHMDSTLQGSEDRLKKERKAGRKAAKNTESLKAPESETLPKQTLENANPAPTPDASSAVQTDSNQAAEKLDAKAAVADKDVEMTDAPTEKEPARAKRNTRKSVRISEGDTAT